MAVAISFNTDVDTDRLYTDDGGAFSADLSSSTAFDYFPNNAAINDAIYFGRVSPFRNITIYVGTSFAATSQTFVWEYYDTGNSWSVLTVGNGDALTLSNQQIVTFSPPADWKMAIVNNAKGFWVRCRISAVNTPTEGGAQSTQKVQVGDNRVEVTGGTVGTPARLSDIKTANDGGGWGVVTQIDGDWDAYQLDADLIVGDGSTSTYFYMEKEILILPHGSIEMNSNATATWEASRAVISEYARKCRLTLATAIQKIFNGVLDWYQVDWTIGIDTTAVPGHRWIHLSNLTSSNLDECFVDGIHTNGISLNYGTITDCRFGDDFLTFVPGTLSGIETVDDFYVRTSTDFTLTNAVAGDELRIGSIGLPGTLEVHLRNPVYSSLVMVHGNQNHDVDIEYGLDLAVQDRHGNVISGGLVTITDADGSEVTNEIMDGSGEITQQWLVKENLFYDRVSRVTTTTPKTPHQAKITKTGYVTKQIQYDMSEARVEIETLENRRVV